MSTFSLASMRASPNVLIVAKTSAQGADLEKRIGRIGHRAEVLISPAAISETLNRRLPDAIVVELDEAPSLSLVERLVHEWPDLGAVLIQENPQPAVVARAIALGVADVLARPFGDEELGCALAKAMATTSALVNSPPAGSVDGDLLGESKAMHQVRDLLGRAAPRMATVLIRGESGTGKELAARTLHRLSPRGEGPFVKVLCAALPETLLESEIFGYERGAFTGAMTRKPGRVELANGGTLFLDEIGDITPAIQVKLLRLLQDREFERLGGKDVLKADVRFVAATHRNLEEMVKTREFREDLFYRLNVVTSWLPPLRSRRDDIAPLARHFCAFFGPRDGKPDASISEDALALLRSRRWPGNVRELQNFVEKLVVLSDGPLITRQDIERELSLEGTTFATQRTGLPDDAAPEVASRGLDEGDAAPSSDQAPSSRVMPLNEELQQTERHALLRALRHTKGNRTLAARVLGVARATLYKKLEEHGIT